MNAKTLRTLGIVTVVLAAAAGIVTVKRGGTRAVSRVVDGDESPLLFPALSDRINEVARVHVANKDGAFDLERTGETWGMPSKGGFPVDFGKVKELVVGIANLEKLEPKTKTSENYAKLGVEDVGAVDAQSTLVKLSTKDGSELASVLIGNPRQSTGAGKPSLYVRKQEEPQSWLVQGRIFVEPTPGTWLEKTVAEIGRERIARVTTTHPDGEVVRVSKTAPEDSDWTVQDVPEGRELSWKGVAGGIAGPLARLTLQDVKPASEVDLASDVTTVSEYETWDGLRVTVRAQDEGDESFLALSAEFDPTLRADTAPSDTTPSEADPSEDAEAHEEGEEGDEADTEEPAKPLGKTAEEVQAEADQLNARWQDWIYVVPGYTASNFKKRMSELLKPLPEPGSGDDAEIGPALPDDMGDMAPLSLEELFPDGLPEELRDIDFEAQDAVDETEDGLEDDAKAIEKSDDVLGGDDLPSDDEPNPAESSDGATGGR